MTICTAHRFAGPHACPYCERDTARELLRRAIVYAREDKARTPGSTRLARVLAEAERVVQSSDQIAPDTAEPAEKQPDSR